MSERRFNEAEVAAIFERAAEAQQKSQRQLPSADGMTLTELQEIGREVGISPDQLVQAARAIELGGRQTSRQFMGLPIGVGLTMDLERKLSDQEWDRLVADLRETFDARGKLTHEGSSRMWANGNLQVLLEPTAAGQRIRFRTVKGDAQGYIIGGLMMFGFAAVAVTAAVLRGPIDDIGFLTALGTLAAGGTAMLGIGALRVPGWARLRRRQMEEIAARVAIVTSAKALPMPDLDNEG